MDLKNKKNHKNKNPSKTKIISSRYFNKAATDKAVNRIKLSTLREKLE